MIIEFKEVAIAPASEFLAASYPGDGFYLNTNNFTLYYVDGEMITQALVLPPYPIGERDPFGPKGDDKVESGEGKVTMREDFVMRLLSFARDGQELTVDRPKNLDPDDPTSW